MSFSYRNGYVPDDKLITFASGWLPAEGAWKHQLPPDTYVKHVALVALAKRNTGRDLKPTEGWSCYRPFSVQVYAKKVYGIWAATPGTSSHGMFWEGKQCAAIDYGNWSYVYNGDRSAFYRDVRAVGLTPGLISTERGYPDEPWHVVDLDPWAAVPASGGGSTISKEATIMAEAIVSAPNGVVVHLRPGGKTNFATTDEYNLVRDNVAALRKLGATDLMPLPALAKVPKVTWAVFNALCDYMGAPKS